MYQRILVAIENSAADRTILEHVAGLVRLTGARLVLVHVADGWVARNFDGLKLRESEEMKADRAYLEQLRNELAAQGKAILMISSELPEVLGMADRVLVMHEGRLAGELSRGEADEESVVRLATGREGLAA